MTNKVIFHTIPEQIAAQLRRDILVGELKPDQPLREQQVAKSFGVSRGPIREVFRQLTQQGLLVSRPNKGVRVATQLSESIRPLIVELRIKIETFALASIFDQITDQDLTYWESILADIKKACLIGDTAALMDHDLRFHRAIIQSHSEKDLLAIWQPVAFRMLMHYTRLGDLMESYYEHKRILDAIRERDLDAALEALKANIQ